MASASRLLQPAPPSAALLQCQRARLAVPWLRCRVSATLPSLGAGVALLERGDAAGIAMREFVMLDELRAAVNLRIRTFYDSARTTEQLLQRRSIKHYRIEFLERWSTSKEFLV